MMTDCNSANPCSACYAVLSTIIRLITLGYAALAVFAFFEMQALLRSSKSGDSFEIDDGTLYVPLILCFPANLDVDGIVLIEAHNSTDPAYIADPECRQLDYLISACASSLLFAAAACILFVFCDFLARFRCCPFDMNSSAGMAIFLSFILVQAGLSTGALVEQNHYFVEHFKELVDDLNVDLDVQSFANSFFLVSSALSAFGVAFLVLVDAACYRCCHRQETVRRRDEDKTDEEEAIEGMKRQAKEVEDAAQSSVSQMSSDSNTAASSNRPPWIQLGV